MTHSLICLCLEKVELLVSYELHGRRLKRIENFWRLLRLRSLTLEYYSIQTDDAFFIKISTTFVCLEELRVHVQYQFSNLTKRGIKALSALKKLHTLELTNTYNNDDKVYLAAIDEGCRHLASLGILQKICLHREELSPQMVNFSFFIHHCPKLKELELQRIEGISTLDEIVAFLQSLRSFPQESLTIRMEGYGSWKSAEVQAALDIVNAATGRRSISFSLWGI